MSIALTGTPGVGKTTVSKILKKRGYDILDLNRFLKEKEASLERKISIGTLLKWISNG